MASPEILDFEVLLAPISDEEPAGPELKEDASLSAVYYEVKDAREAARTAERRIEQAAWAGDEAGDGSITPPDWGRVFSLATKVIAETSKDLWITAWLIEALVREHGFAGLRDGFRLARELSERFWDGIHPRPDEDGAATTVAQLTGLNGDDSEGALIAPVDAIPITAGAASGALTSADFRRAVELERMTDPDKRAERIEQGAVSMQTFDKAVDETPPEFLTNLLEDIDQCIEEFSQLGQVLEERCGTNEDGYSAAPPSSNIRNALVECRDRVRVFVRRRLGDEAEELGEMVPVEGSRGEPVTTAGGMTREDAFRALLKVADFFRRTEPHSPVSYALEQAVRWGRMPLPELLTELISDESTREEMFRRTGIPRPDSSDSG